MFCGKKPVLISVYVVRPRRRNDLTNGDRRRRRHHHHHFHHVHHLASGGYDRKAELLLYCQHLRAAARREQASTTSTTKSNIPHHTANKIVPLRRNPSYARTPTCLGDWKKMLLPGFFLRSVVHFQEKEEKKKKKKKKMKEPSASISSKMNAIVKSLRVEKKPGFVKKLLSTFGNHR